MVDLAAIIPFILTVILETMDDIVIIGESLFTLPFVLEILDDLAVIATNVFIFTIILNTMVDIFSMSFLFIILETPWTTLR